MDVALSARAAGIRIFTVGLRSRSFDGRSLEQLAGDTHGDYAEARKSSDLAPIYAALGARLANEYLIRYRSLAGRGTVVHVEVTAAGVPGPITNDYTTPPIGSTQLRPGKASGFWSSSLSLVVVCFACALLIGLATAAVLWRRPRPETVPDRLRHFVSAPPEEGRPAGRRSPTACSGRPSDRSRPPAGGRRSRRSWRSAASSFPQYRSSRSRRLERLS
jgi:hypothetical protein